MSIAGTYPTRLPRLIDMMFSNPYRPKAFSISDFLKKLEYRGANMLKQAFPAPMNMNASRKYSIVLEARRRPIPDIINAMLTIIIIFFPYLSARIPHGMANRLQVNEFIMNIVPSCWPLNPRATR
jgi:hypothetical protein